MYLRIFILCFIVLIHSVYITAQPKRSIYISDDVAQKFTSGVMERDASEYSFFRFLQYQTLSQQLVHTDEYERVYRLGVLLPASSTISDTIHALASFGNETGGCLIDYQTLIRTVWQGRSAALSVLNAFLKPSERVHQSQPYTNIYSTGIRGLIFHKRDTSSFSYNIWYVRKKKPIGWLNIDDKRLSCLPVSYQYRRKGKLRKAKYNFVTGFLLENNGHVYAALDQSQSRDDIVYVDNQPDEDEKLMIASYLSIVVCYEKK